VPEAAQIIDLGEATPSATRPLVSALDGVTRPLPQETVIEATGSSHALFAQCTDLGRVRTNNEDSVYSFYATGRSAEGVPDFGLFVVADGMGGHSEGERASAIAVLTVANYILREVYLPLLNHEDREAPIAEVMTTAIQRANDAVVKDLEDAGTTVSAAVLIGDLAYIGHVGDSRVYMINRGRIERVTRDHSWVQRLIELDQLSPDEATEHPQKNLLYRALGQSDTLEVDTLMRRLSPNAKMLLCSDGLWNQVSDAAILEAITQAPTPQDACTKLVELANDAGGPDNITAILLQLPG
jgi:protein phosphatase